MYCGFKLAKKEQKLSLRAKYVISILPECRQQNPEWVCERARSCLNGTPRLTHPVGNEPGSPCLKSNKSIVFLRRPANIDAENVLESNSPGSPEFRHRAHVLLSNRNLTRD